MQQHNVQSSIPEHLFIITVDNVTQVETLNYTRYGNDPIFNPNAGQVIAIPRSSRSLQGEPFRSFIAVDGGTVPRYRWWRRNSAEFFLRPNRDADGKLTYSKVKWDSNESIEFANGEGIFVNGLEHLLDSKLDDGTPMNAVQSGYVEPSRESWQTNSVHRKYEQQRFDNNKLFYYINSRGYLVARYNRDYTHTGPA